MKIHRSIFGGLTVQLLFACSLVSPYVAAAQSSAQERPPRFHQGMWGLQFSVLNNFTLGSFQGALISCQYHLSNTSAIRIGVDLNLELGDANSVTSTKNDTLDNTRLSSSTGDRQDGGLTLHFVSYINPDQDITAYWGVGPTVRYSRTHSNSTLSSTQGQQSFSNSVNTSDSWYLGGALIGGAEWFVTRSFALHAEYGLAYTYSWSSSTSGGTSVRTTAPVTTTSSYDSHSHSWALSSKTVRLGLSVYF